MQTCRKWKSVKKGTNWNARSGLGTHTHLAVLTTSLRRQLLNETVVGVGIE
jgi:hypothetical protein